jgi:TetR/AcrR family tetracycline transcriptional repressor
MKLNKDSIINAGLTYSQEHDVESLSFRKLAEALDVSAMALYRHFENKEALLIAMLDRFIEQANVLPSDGASLGWASWLEHVATRMFEALLSQPSWLPLLGQLPLQHSGLTVFNACLEQLENSGFSQQQAVDAFFAMLQILFGAAICQQQLQQTTLLNSENNYPYIEAASAQLIATQQRPQIDMGLKILIAGLKAQRQT